MKNGRLCIFVSISDSYSKVQAIFLFFYLVFRRLTEMSS